MVRRTKEEAQETRNQILEAAEKAFYNAASPAPRWRILPNWRV